MRPGDDQLRGHDRTDAALVEQRRRECPYVAEQLALELGGLDGCGLDPAGEAAQHEPCRDLVGAHRARAAEAATTLEQPAHREPAQLLAELVGCCHDHAAELSERFAAHVDGAATCDQEQPQRLPAFAAACQRERLAAKRRPRGPGGVQRIVFPTQAPLRPRRTADLEHRLAAASEVPGKAGAVAACALNRPDAGAFCLLRGEPKRRRLAAPARVDRAACNHRTRGRGSHCQHVFVAGEQVDAVQARRHQVVVRGFLCI